MPFLPTFYDVEGVPATLGIWAAGLNYCIAWDKGGPRKFDLESLRRNGTAIDFLEFAALVDQEGGSIEALLPQLVDVPDGVELLISFNKPVTLDLRIADKPVAYVWHTQTPQPYNLRSIPYPYNPPTFHTHDVWPQADRVDRATFFACRSRWLKGQATPVVISGPHEPVVKMVQIAGRGGILLQSNWHEIDDAKNKRTSDLDRQIIDIAFVNNGLEIIALNGKGELQGFDAKTGQPKTERVPLPEEFRFSALSADGCYVRCHVSENVIVHAEIGWLMGGSESGALTIEHTQRTLRSAPHRPMQRDVGPLHTLQAKVYSTEEPRQRIPWYPGQSARHPRFSPDGTRITMGHEDGCASVWEVGTGKLLFETPDVGQVMILADLSADGALLVTRALSYPPMVWCMQTGRVLAVLDGAHDALPANRPNEVLVIGRDKVWRHMKVPTTPVSFLGRLFSGDRPQTQLVLNAMTGRSSSPWPSLDIEVAPDGRTATIQCDENKVQLVSLSDRRSTHIVEPSFPVNGCRYSADGAKLAIYGRSPYLQIVVLGRG